MLNKTQQVMKSDRRLLAAQYVTAKINGTYWKSAEKSGSHGISKSQ